MKTFFIDNKYARWYFAIVEKAKKCQPSIFEKHHIIPRSLGGSDNLENLVKLSFKQHYLCHKLLTKMTNANDKRKMVYALHMMSLKSKQHIRTSKSYEYTRKLRKELGVSEETKRKMSESMIGKNVGKIASEETKRKMSIAAKDRVISTATKQRIAERVQQEWDTGIRSKVGQKRVETRSLNGNWSPPMLGKSHTEETRLKQSIAAKNDPRRKQPRGPLTEEAKRKIAEKAKERWAKKREQAK